MAIDERLRQLDDRVLGKPKPTSEESQRRSFLVGLGAIALIVFLAGATGHWDAALIACGPLGVTIVAGVRWRKAVRSRA